MKNEIRKPKSAIQKMQMATVIQSKYSCDTVNQALTAVYCGDDTDQVPLLRAQVEVSVSASL